MLGRFAFTFVESTSEYGENTLFKRVKEIAIRNKELEITSPVVSRGNFVSGRRGDKSQVRTLNPVPLFLFAPEANNLQK